MVGHDVHSVEFSRCIKIDEIGKGDSSHEITATADECAALAKRFDLLKLDNLQATIMLSKHSNGIQAKGQFSASLEQACIASNEAIADTIDDEIDILFLPLSEQHIVPDSEVELAADECDVMLHDGRVIDIGEAVAQSLALSINPYPRSKNADQQLRAAGVKRDDDVIAPSGPFAALSAIKDKMARK
jgi:uncharacterized metal-binding protein YceD (DUF177 family)